MVLAIDALRVGSRDPPQATLDVSGSIRCSQDASVNNWSIGSLSTGNAGLVYAGLPCNAAALFQTPSGQTTINSALGQVVQFSDAGVVGLKYSRSALIGNLTLAGGLDANAYDQVLQVRTTGLASNTSQSLTFGAYSNGTTSITSQNSSLILAANGNPALSLYANGQVSFSPTAVAFGDSVHSNVQIGSSSLTSISNGLLIQGNCVTINQPNPVSGAAFDVLGGVHIGGGGLRVDGNSISLGYPGTVSVDSSGVSGGRFNIDNNGKTSIGGSLSVSGPVSLTQQLNLVSGQAVSLVGDSNNILKYDASVNGPRLQGFSGGVLGAAQGTANALAWTAANCSSFLPFNIAAPLTVGANTTVISPDPYLSLGRSNVDCILAVSSSVNNYSNAAAQGDVVLKNRNGGNVLIQSGQSGPGLYLTANNTLGIQTATVNPNVSLDVGGSLHAGQDNVGSRIVNLTGKTFYNTVPTWRQLAVFYATNNSGNGAHLTITGPCGPWSGARGELKASVTTSGILAATAQWTGGIPSGVDVQVYVVGNVASVWINITTAYAAYNFDVVYGGQGFTSLAQAETTTTPSGTMIFSAASNSTLTTANASVSLVNMTAAGVVQAANLVSSGNIQAGNLVTAGNIYSSGNMTANGNFYGYSYQNWSDARLKDDIGDAESFTHRLSDLKVRRFSWKADKSRQAQIGLIAQEVEQVLPELVQNPTNSYKSIDNSALIPILLQAVQNLQVRVTDLEHEKFLMARHT